MASQKITGLTYRSVATNDLIFVGDPTTGLGYKGLISDIITLAQSSLNNAIAGKVSTSVTVNGHPLTSNVTVTKTDVGLGNVPNVDATSASNIVQTSNFRFVNDTQIGNWNTAFGWGNHAGLYPSLASTYNNPSWIIGLAAAKITGLSTVATSGSYTDLTNKPTIPAQFNLIAGTNVTISGSYPNITINASGGTTVPTWTTSSRPGSPTTGQQGYNTTTNYFEYWNGSTWKAMTIEDAPTAPVGVPSVVYWGSKSTPGNLTQQQIVAGNAVSITANQVSTTINFTSVIQDAYLWWAEPSTEPAKLYRYANSLDNGAMGVNDAFALGVIVGQYRFYIVNYPTSNTVDQQQFKTTP